jgi:hypothetical protein
MTVWNKRLCVASGKDPRSEDNNTIDIKEAVSRIGGECELVRRIELLSKQRKSEELIIKSESYPVRNPVVRAFKK